MAKKRTCRDRWRLRQLRAIRHEHHEWILRASRLCEPHARKEAAAAIVMEYRARSRKYRAGKGPF